MVCDFLCYGYKWPPAIGEPNVWLRRKSFFLFSTRQTNSWRQPGTRLRNLLITVNFQILLKDFSYPWRQPMLLLLKYHPQGMIFKTCLLRRCCYLTYPKHVLDHVITHCLSCNIPKIATLSSVILQESWFFRTRFSQTELKNGATRPLFLSACFAFIFLSLVMRLKEKAQGIRIKAFEAYKFGSTIP